MISSRLLALRTSFTLFWLLACATSLHGAQSDSIRAGRWLGGLIDDGDFTAVVVKLSRPDAQWRAQLALPNQLRSWLADSVRVDGVSLRIYESGREWRGELRNGVLTGQLGATERFELVHAPEVELPHSIEGEYAGRNGRYRIDRLRRPNDELLRLTTRSSGDERWLFPTGAREFTTGVSFESPRPVESRVKLVQLNDNSLVVIARGSTADTASRIPLHVDSAAIARAVLSIMERERIPGAAVAIVTADGVRFQRAFGVRDVARKLPAHETTLFQIGSITKTFTAALTMRLREQGRLNLDERVVDILPRDLRFADPRAASITIRHLLTHSSGLPGNPPNRVDVDGVMQPYSRADLYAGIRRTVLQFETGGGLGYSNYGFALLGHLLELKTGRTFAQLLQEHILTPVDLRSTSLQLGEAQLRNAALHYWPEDSTWVPRPRWSFGEIAAFGGLSTTIGDLARYATAMLRSDSTILSARSMREMHALQVPRGSWLAGFGYSWFVERNRPQGVLVYHGGEVDGNSAYLAIAPLLNVAIAVMANMGGAAANNLGAEVLAAATDAARRHRTFTADEAQRLFINQHWELAAIAYDGLLTARPDWGVAAFRAGFAWYQLNDHIRALPALQRAADLDFQPGLAAFYAAVITTQRGDHNAAIALLQNAVAKGFKDRRELETNTGLNALRSDERFVRLVKGLEGN